jgi:hypothetical protein
MGTTQGGRIGVINLYLIGVGLMKIISLDTGVRVQRMVLGMEPTETPTTNTKDFLVVPKAGVIMMGRLAAAHVVINVH